MITCFSAEPPGKNLAFSGKFSYKTQALFDILIRRPTPHPVVQRHNHTKSGICPNRTVFSPPRPGRHTPQDGPHANPRPCAQYHPACHAPAADWSASTNSVICILDGTLITTPAGERAIEAVTVGDMVTTPDGPRRVRWVGRSSYHMAFLRGKPMSLPVCIHAGALGEGLPVRDLWVSPWHAVLFGETLVRAFDLINGMNVTHDFPGTAVTLHNIELDSPGVIFAQGAPVDTYSNHNNRAMFHNVAEYVALYGSVEPNWMGADGQGVRRYPLLAEDAPELAEIAATVCGRALRAA